MALTSTWAVPIYADIADLADWVPDTKWPVDVDVPEQEAMIRQASIIVRAATSGAFYLSDTTTGLPTSADALAVLTAAVGAQVQAWVFAGIRWPGSAGLAIADKTVTSLSGGGRSVSYQQATQAQLDARAALTAQLAPAARAILLGAGAIRRQA